MLGQTGCVKIMLFQIKQVFEIDPNELCFRKIGPNGILPILKSLYTFRSICAFMSVYLMMWPSTLYIQFKRTPNILQFPKASFDIYMSDTRSLQLRETRKKRLVFRGEQLQMGWQAYSRIKREKNSANLPKTWYKVLTYRVNHSTGRHDMSGNRTAMVTKLNGKRLEVILDSTGQIISRTILSNTLGVQLKML